jgi:UDP-3-O-[3-hydroxymyristoyl] glucosamine N-acyltransferase
MPGPFTLGQIVSRLGGRVAGDASVSIRQVGSLENAAAGQISFLSSGKFKSRLAGTAASAVIVAAEDEGITTLPRIVVDKPYLYFARVSQLFNPLTLQPAGVHPSAVVSEKAVLGKGVSIGAGCVVGEGASIGDGSCLYPRVVVYPGCSIGKRAIIHSGVVIGADGFGIAPDAGTWVKIPQIGSVRIGDDVEIGANSTIDRGAIDDTVIEDGVKMDNQIQVGHNCRIGAHTAIAGCAGIAGSTDIGKHCIIGGAAMIQGHIRIADHVTISGGTTITKSILEAGTYTSIFPFDEHKSWMRTAALLRHLDELAERIKRLERKGKEE